MKYSEVPGGAIFYFEGNPNYPKRKVGLGHIDIRDNVSGSGAGLQNHEVYLQEAAQQSVQRTACRCLCHRNVGVLHDVPCCDSPVE